MAQVRCDCGRLFESTSVTQDICPPCQRREDAQFAVLEDVPFTPWRFSRTAMRERLGTLTDQDQ